MPPWSRVRHRIERERAREQEQLGVARALIEDATGDTMLWIGSAALGNSAEERVHALAMQKALADLARIVERRIEGRHEVDALHALNEPANQQINYQKRS